MEPSSLSASLLGILGRQQKDSVQTTCPGSASWCCVMEEVQWGAFGVAQPLEGAGREHGAAYLPLQVGGDVSDLDLSAPAKTKPRVTVTGGQRLPEAFWEQDGETLRGTPLPELRAAALQQFPASPGGFQWRNRNARPWRRHLEVSGTSSLAWCHLGAWPGPPQGATATQRLPGQPARCTREVLGQNSRIAHPEQHLQSFLSQFPPPDCYFFPFCCYF